MLPIFNVPNKLIAVLDSLLEVLESRTDTTGFNGDAALTNSGNGWMVQHSY